MSLSNYIVIKPSKSFSPLNWNELISYRDLFFTLVTKDIKVRYKQTILGGLWALLQPLMLMIIFTLFFGRFAKIPSNGYPYALFSYSGLILWTYFANALNFSSNSLITNSHLISKVYFPRLLIPVSPIIAGLIDFFIAFIFLLVLSFFYDFSLSWYLLFTPVIVLMLVLNAMGVGFFLSAMNVKFRDVKFTVPFIIQFWMFASPVIYPTTIISRKFIYLYYLNPIAGIIDTFRALAFNPSSFNLFMFFVSFLISIMVFLFGLIYFKKSEKFFADII